MVYDSNQMDVQALQSCKIANLLYCCLLFLTRAENNAFRKSLRTGELLITPETRRNRDELKGIVSFILNYFPGYFLYPLSIGFISKIRFSSVRLLWVYSVINAAPPAEYNTVGVR
jgi:hypothetical protein